MIQNLTQLNQKHQQYDLIKSDIHNNISYGIAWDISIGDTNNKKRYYSCRNYTEYEDIVRRINRYKMNENKEKEFDIKQRIYYEIIGKQFKPHFDIDIKTDCDKVTEYQFNLFIKNEFIPYFNRFMNTNITYDDILIYTRTKWFLSSVHIIIKNLQTNAKTIKDFLNYLFTICDNQIVNFIDTKIYTKNRLFNLPYNTKLKKYNDNPTNPNYFIDFKEQEATPKDYLVSYRVGLQHIDTKKNNATTKMYNAITKHARRTALSYAFDKLKNCKRQQITCCDNMKLDGHDEDGMYCLSCNYLYKPNYFTLLNKKIEQDKAKKEKKTEQSKDQTTRKNIYFECVMDTYDFILLNLPTFFYKSLDWKFITTLFKKYGITEEQFDNWNRISVHIGGKDKYTIESNKGYFNSIDKAKIKSGIPKFKEVIEKYITEYTFIFEKKNELTDWIHSKLLFFKNVVQNVAITKHEINEILQDTNDTNGIYIFGDITYNSFNGFLIQKQGVLSTNENETKPYNIVLGNYFHEVDFKTIYERTKIENLTEYDTIQDTFELVDNFVTNNDKVFSLKAKWGSGKSHFVIKRMIYEFKNQGCRIIFLTENNALNKQIEKAYNTEDFILISHIDKSSNILKTTEHNIVCSLESIQKINFTEKDILILDEYESIINHFESDTFENKNFPKFNELKKAIKTCKKIVLTDADISQARVMLMERITNTKIQTIQANTNNFIDYNFNVWLDCDQMLKNVKKDISEYKICVASSTRTLLEYLYKEYITKYANKRILKIDGNGIEVNFLDLELKKTEILKNLELFLHENKVDILLYSPTIKTGVSINDEYFDKCYAVGSHNSLCVREFIQMLFRARQLKQKEINISFKSSFKKPQSYISNDRIGEVLLGEPAVTYYMLEQLSNNNTEKQLTDYTNIFNIDDYYYRLKTINAYENYNSKKAYTQEFIIRMLYNHNIKLNYICFQDQEQEQEETKDEDITEENVSKLFLAPLITREKYLEHQYKDTFKKLEFWTRTKADFFYKKMCVNGVSNLFEYDQDIYDRINTDEFYKTYQKQKTAYNNITAIINNCVENKLETYKDKDKNILLESLENEESNDYCDTKLNFLKTNDSKLVFVNIIIDKLNINLLKIPCLISNKELDNLFDNSQFKTLVTDFIKNTEMDLKDHEQKFKMNTKKGFVSYIKHILKENLNLKINYVDRKNTTRTTDKMIIDYIDFTIPKEEGKSKFNSLHRETHTDLKLAEKQISKLKRAFFYKINDTEKVTAYKQLVKKFDNTEYSYYTTYEVKLNKKTTILKSRISGYTIKAHDTNVILYNEIIGRKIKPYIIKDLDRINYNIFLEYEKIISGNNEIEEIEEIED
jgi:hypothetical protein